MSILAICLGVKPFTPPPMLAARKHEISDKPKEPVKRVNKKPDQPRDIRLYNTAAILGALYSGATTATEIVEVTKVHESTARRILTQMLRQQKVRREKDGRITRWMVCR